MLVVVGGEGDRQIDRLLDRLGPRGAVRMDASDLSAPGWRLSPEHPGAGVVVAGGRPIEEAAIGGILVRRLAVYEQELAGVHAEDRAYAAGELTALLAWWLTAIPATVLNRPARGVLCGPFARSEQWLSIAARIGLPVVTGIRTTYVRPPPPAPRHEVTVIGDRTLRAAPREMADRALALAHAAGATLLQVGFDEAGQVQSAHCFPDLDAPVIDAIGDLLLPARRNPRPAPLEAVR